MQFADLCCRSPDLKGRLFKSPDTSSYNFLGNKVTLRQVSPEGFNMINPG